MITIITSAAVFIGLIFVLILLLLAACCCVAAIAVASVYFLWNESVPHDSKATSDACSADLDKANNEEQTHHSTKEDNLRDDEL